MGVTVGTGAMVEVGMAVAGGEGMLPHAVGMATGVGTRVVVAWQASRSVAKAKTTMARIEKPGTRRQDRLFLSNISCFLAPME